MTPDRTASPDSATRWRVLPALLAGLAAFCLVWLITAPPGPGLDPDSMSYVSASESLVHHGVLRVPAFYDWASPDSTEPLAHFPPGLPTALAIPRILGAPEPTAARLVEATAAFVTAATVCLMVASASGAAAGALAVLMVFATPAIVGTHLSILSEPLFYALLALTLASMVWRPDHPLLAGIVAAAGSLVRYAGLSLVGAAVLWMFARGGSARDRLRRALVAALPTIVAFGAWLVRTRWETGGGVRDVSVYSGFAATVQQGVDTMASWLAPALDDGPWRSVVALVGLAALIALVAAAARRLARAGDDRARGTVPRRLLAATSMLAVVYVAFVVLSRLFADGAIPFDDRILSPLILLLEIATVVSLAAWWRPQRIMLRAVAASALLVWWGASLVVSWRDVRDALTDGADYADTRWRTSPLVAWARGDGAGCAIFTNHPTALYFQAHRFSRGTPLDQPSDTLRALADTIAARGGALVAFDERNEEFAIPPDSVLRALSLRPALRTTDGAVWISDSRARCAAAPVAAQHGSRASGPGTRVAANS